MRAPFLLAMAMLAACATQSGFQARMQALVGQPEAELVRRLGPPNADFVAQGRRFLRWDDLGVPMPQGPGPGMGFGFGGAPLSGQGIATGPLVAASMNPAASSCSVRFEIMEGRAVGFISDGMGCEAAPPR